MEHQNNKQLVNRLNRIIGQIEAIRDNLVQESESRNVAEEDCVTTITHVKAANNALKKFAETYLHYYLQQCLDKNLEMLSSGANNKNDAYSLQNLRKMQKNLEAVIRSSFAM